MSRFIDIIRCRKLELTIAACASVAVIVILLALFLAERSATSDNANLIPLDDSPLPEIPFARSIFGPLASERIMNYAEPLRQFYEQKATENRLPGFGDWILATHYRLAPDEIEELCALLEEVQRSDTESDSVESRTVTIAKLNRAVAAVPREDILLAVTAVAASEGSEGYSEQWINLTASKLAIDSAVLRAALALPPDLSFEIITIFVLEASARSSAQQLIAEGVPIQVVTSLLRDDFEPVRRWTTEMLIIATDLALEAAGLDATEAVRLLSPDDVTRQSYLDEMRPDLRAKLLAWIGLDTSARQPSVDVVHALLQKIGIEGAELSDPKAIGDTLRGEPGTRLLVELRCKMLQISERQLEALRTGRPKSIEPASLHLALFGAAQWMGMEIASDWFGVHQRQLETFAQGLPMTRFAPGQATVLAGQWQSSRLKLLRANAIEHAEQLDQEVRKQLEQFTSPTESQ